MVDGAGGVVALQQRKLGPACGLATRFALTPRFGSVTGAFARARAGWTVFSHTEPPAVALAGNARGVAVVAWLGVERDARGRCIHPATEFVRVAVRQPGRPFGALETLAHHVSAGPIAAAVSARRAPRRLAARLEARSAHAHPARRVAPDAAHRERAAGLTHRRLGTRRRRLPGLARPSRERLERRPQRRRGRRAAGAARFNAATLDRATWPNDPYDIPSRFTVRLALLRHGAIAAWTSSDGTRLRVLTATSRGGRFAAARQATPAGQDYALGDLATGPTGRPALALTATPVTTPTGPFFALGSAAGSFGAPEAIGAGTAHVDGEALAFSPRTGRPTLVWTEVRPAAQTITLALASTRSTAGPVR